ncbi:MAG: hypothetical protein ACJ8EH_07505 [Sphingomicrobium sp.]
MTALFWAFSYVLLTIRGAIFHDDWGQTIDDNRLLAVTVGACAYFLVLKQLQSGIRLTFRTTLVWIAAATLAIMIVRVTIDELVFSVPQGFDVNLLWSLTWSAYFGLWVMGSLAFARVTPVALPSPLQIATTVPEWAATVEGYELLIDALLSEAAELKTMDRERLAAKIISIGGYEAIEGLPRETERARLALRLASRLSSRS